MSFAPVRREQRGCGAEDCSRTIRNHDEGWRSTPAAAAQRRARHGALEVEQELRQVVAPAGMAALFPSRPPRRCGCGCRRLAIGPDACGHRRSDGRCTYFNAAHREYSLLRLGNFSRLPVALMSEISPRRSCRRVSPGSRTTKTSARSATSRSRSAAAEDRSVGAMLQKKSCRLSGEHAGRRDGLDLFSFAVHLLRPALMSVKACIVFAEAVMGPPRCRSVRAIMDPESSPRVWDWRAVGAVAVGCGHGGWQREPSASASFRTRTRVLLERRNAARPHKTVTP